MPLHRKRLRRHDIAGTARYIIFSCYCRLRLFDNDLIKDHFVQALCKTVASQNVSVIAWGVMPEHIRLIVYSESEAVITPFLQKLKDAVARTVIARWRTLSALVLPRLVTHTGDTHFWQPGGGYDRNFIGDELIEKIIYIHKNPIERGLSLGSTEWRWFQRRRISRAARCDGPTHRVRSDSAYRSGFDVNRKTRPRVQDRATRHYNEIIESN